MDRRFVSRRALLRSMRWAPTLLLPSPLCSFPLDFHFLPRKSPFSSSLPFADFQLTPHYPAKSPLEDVLKLVEPGLDSYVTEKHCAEIAVLLTRWSKDLKSSSPALTTLSEFVDPAVEFNSLDSAQDTVIRTGGSIESRIRKFSVNRNSGRDLLLSQIKQDLTRFKAIATAELEITHVKLLSSDPLRLATELRCSLVGIDSNGAREERIATWNLRWMQDSNRKWWIDQWIFAQERVNRTSDLLFRDVSATALGKIASYSRQLRHGVDYWRTVVDGASGIDVYGNNGIASGDFDNDGFDDIYICQPSGLPNRLYRNLGDGTFEDVTESSGLEVLDATACAIFADFENKGLQDLLVVCASGPLLFLNQGNGKFQLKRNAFAFTEPPQGTFTHAAVADYDHDGQLDVYFCLYSYYLGLDQYHYPSPYFDARNGPPNFLFHNDGNGAFSDRTEASGLNAENDRFSFACAWGDINSNGWPDLYVANDFGRSNLYRNRGDGTFEAISDAAGANDPGAGMSACWADFDNDGRQDIYVSNMWSAAGQRVSEQPIFHANDPAEIQSHYRRHARGNSLYKNLGNSHFKNVGDESGVEMGRWAWSSDSWDFDHDGYSDLYIANGYISGPDARDLGSFFWRQVVGNSPSTSTPSLPYERGWNAINELIRSDSTWNGYERNTFYLNNRDGTFSEISGVSGLDFLDDSRSFALADLDHDGRLEVILKNRNSPQLRVLQNVMPEIGDAVSFRLRGSKSNRDAIGASVTVQSGALRQTKCLQAGSGFLSQHAKELFFGLGKDAASVSATVRWPSGLTQSFQNLPINHRIDIKENRQDFISTQFGPPSPAYSLGSSQTFPVPDAGSSESWLLDPLPAPDFSLPDLSGQPQSLPSFRGKPLLLAFWAQAAESSTKQLLSFQKDSALFRSNNLQILSINVDASENVAAARAFLLQQRIPFPVLLATPDVIGIFSILFRYLFDRRRDLPIPISFLIDEAAMIVKIYQGAATPGQIVRDLASIPRNSEQRRAKALPFPGTLYNGAFARNDFTYGVALFQRGYLDHAVAAFKQVVAAKPNDPEAYYNLGTLYLRKNQPADAQNYLEQTVKLRPDYPEAWNNLGMIAVQQNQPEAATGNFKQSLKLRPNYTVALLNLGNLYRRQGNNSQAANLLTKALALEPENPEANYSLGMLYARQNNFARAIELLQNATRFRPDYSEAWNNLGVIHVRQGHNTEAEQSFRQCIAVAPNFDQAYLNLANLYMLSNDKEKARAVLQSLLRLQPNHKLAQQALEMLN
jgi:Flp pilus assembly protein TadD/peroxiredoxin